MFLFMACETLKGACLLSCQIACFDFISHCPWVEVGSWVYKPTGHRASCPVSCPDRRTIYSSHGHPHLTITTSPPTRLVLRFIFPGVRRPELKDNIRLMSRLRILVAWLLFLLHTFTPWWFTSVLCSPLWPHVSCLLSLCNCTGLSLSTQNTLRYS